MTLDFTSSLYLGMRHEHRSLTPWRAFSSGKPAVLGPPQPAAGLAARVARLAGCAAGLLFPSTLHLFWDLFVALGCEAAEWVIHCDAELYPVARWGVERAAGRGGAVRVFPHLSPGSLEKAIRRDGRRPVVVTDGYCVACGRGAPLRAYAELVRARDGYLVIDDTQAFGVLGEPAVGSPFGVGGGGSLRHAGAFGSEVLWAASVAKGFGVPIAVLAGSRATLAHLERTAETRTHSSPPSNATLAALAHALDLNERTGESRRLQLAHAVHLLRNGVRELGLAMSGGVFPVQRMVSPVGASAFALQRRLEAAGVSTIVTRSRCSGQLPSVSWLVTSAHSEADVARALETLRRVLRTPHLPVPIAASRRIQGENHVDT